MRASSRLCVAAVVHPLRLAREVREDVERNPESDEIDSAPLTPPSVDHMNTSKRVVHGRKTVRAAARSRS